MRQIYGPDISYFLWSIVCGISAGFLYDFLRLHRRIVKTSDIVVNIEDILFIILGGSAAAILAYVVNNGFFRIYSLISIGLGFIFYRFIIKDRLVKLFIRIYALLRKILITCLKLLLLPLRGVVRIIGRPLFITIRGFWGRAKTGICIKKKKENKY